MKEVKFLQYPYLKMLTILLPAIIIGGFEFIRHQFLLGYLSMEVGNFYITGLTLLLSYWFATWMFGRIERTNKRLVQEQARRAVYEERERLASELHDDIAQTVFFLNVMLQKNHLDDARLAVSEINNHLRQAIYNLRSHPDGGVTLTERLRHWLEEWSIVTGVEVEQEIKLNVPFTPGEEVQLFGTIQEAFTNIRKHSRATMASIQLRSDETGKWMLKVADNGCGLLEKEENASTYGLFMMKKRITELGAEFRIGNQIEGGTEITVTGRIGVDKR